MPCKRIMSNEVRVYRDEKTIAQVRKRCHESIAESGEKTEVKVTGTQTDIKQIRQ